MKKFLAILLSVLFIFSLTACGADNNKKDTTDTDTATKLPSVDKVSEGNSLFVSITNAKGEIEVTTDHDANHKNVKDIIKGDKITNKKDKLFLNHIAFVKPDTGDDRWTATYNCDNIGADATITFTPKDKSANLLGIMCKFDTASASYKGTNYDSITFSQNGTITLNDANTKLNYSSTFDNAEGFGDISITANIKDKAKITIKPLGDKKFQITSDKDLSSFAATYMFNSMSMNAEHSEPIHLSETSAKTAKSFTITITDKITIE